MEKILHSQTNEYYEQADKEAIGFLQARNRLDGHRKDLLDLKTMYRGVFGYTVKNNLPKMLTVPAHLGAAGLEGFVLAPLFNAIFAGFITNEFLLNAISFLPVVIFAGITLAAGHAFHKVSPKADAIHPRRTQKDSGALTTAVAISVFYLLCIGGLTFISHQMLGDENWFSYIILLIGLAELILGYYAIQGWECLYAYTAYYGIETEKLGEVKKINMHAHQCEQNYTFFTQMWSMYCLQEGISIPARMNKRIRLTLDFCEVSEAQESDKERFELIDYANFEE